jgi:predicted kinase
MVAIIMGLPGSGKSYFAKRLAQALHAEYINSDGVRKARIAKSTYSKEEKSSVYDNMLSMVLELVHLQKDVVIDATFYANTFRKKFTDAIRAKTDIRFIEIRADELLIKERLQHKRTDSDADFTVYEIIKSSWERFENDHLVLYSTNDNVKDMLYNGQAYLHQNDKRTN